MVPRERGPASAGRAAGRSRIANGRSLLTRAPLVRRPLIACPPLSGRSRLSAAAFLRPASSNRRGDAIGHRGDCHPERDPRSSQRREIRSRNNATRARPSRCCADRHRAAETMLAALLPFVSLSPRGKRERESARPRPTLRRGPIPWRSDVLARIVR